MELVKICDAKYILQSRIALFLFLKNITLNGLIMEGTVRKAEGTTLKCYDWLKPIENYTCFLLHIVFFIFEVDLDQYLHMW